MKHRVFKSLRTEMVLYGILSLLLTVLSEMVIAFIFVIVGRMLGVSPKGYLRPPQEVKRLEQESMKKPLLPEIDEILHWNESTIISVLSVVIICGVLFFSFYFLMFTKSITKDMRYISNNISQIASGSDKRLEIQRKDEIGEIAFQVNHMAKEIHRLMNAEREALQANKDMIACVAHDLRTPLTSVIGYLQLATNTEDYTQEERQKYAEIAMQKSERLQGLIEDLFRYTKLMSGEISLHRGDIDIVKMVEQMVEEFYPLFEDNDLEFEFNGNIRSQLLYADGELLARAIQNLIGNAIKYGKDGKRVLIGVEKMEKEIHISVTNFGLIIPKESIDHLFDKFYRVENSRSTQTGGSGLGLNIAQEIAVLHGGKIEVESSIQGTVFTLALPIESRED